MGFWRSRCLNLCVVRVAAFSGNLEMGSDFDYLSLVSGNLGMQLNLEVEKVFWESGNANRDNEIIPYLTSMGFWRSCCLNWGVVRVAAFSGNLGMGSEFD